MKKNVTLARWAAVAVVATILSVAVGVAPPASATPTCRQTDNVWIGNSTSGFYATVANCSTSGTTARVAAVLAGSDAFKMGAMASGDRFMANNQFVAWIDTHTAPGILRGLWPITLNGDFDGTQRPQTGGNQSLLSIDKQFRPNSTDTMGYMGLSVEIWTAPQAEGGDYFTYRHQPAPSGTYATRPEQTSAGFTFQLYSRRTGSNVFVGGSGGSASQVTMDAIYTMTPSVFHIETRLRANTAVATRGDLGGLLLLTTQACAVTSPDCSQFVGDHSLHILKSSNAGSGADGAGPMACTPTDGQIGVLSYDGTTAVWDMYALPFTAASNTVDRYCVQSRVVNAGAPDKPLPPVTLSTRATFPGSRMTVTPQYWFNDPYEQGHRNTLAYHFNATPEALAGTTGLGSLDVVFQALDGKSLAFGGNRGYKTFAVDITR